MAKRDGESKRILIGIANSAKTHVMSWIGLGIFWSWLWIIIQRPTFDYRLWDTAIAWRIITLVACAIMFAAVLVSDRFRKSWIDGAAFERFGIIAVAAYTIVYLLLDAFGIASSALEIAGTVLAGPVVAYFYVGWGRSIASLGTRVAFACCSCALVVTVFCSVVVFWIDAPTQDVAIMLLPLISLIIFRFVIVKSQSPDHSTAPAVADENETEENGGAMSLKFLVTVFIMGTALGLLHALFNTVLFEKCSDPYCPLRLLHPLFSASISTEDFYGYASIAGLVLALIVIVVSVSLFKMNFRKLVYQVGFPLMALGFLIIASDSGLAIGGISHVSGTNFVLGELFYIAGYYYTEVIMWTICAYLIVQHRANKTRMFAWTGFVLIVGQLTGFLVSFPLSSIVASQAVLCIIAIFALLFSGLLIATNESMWAEWGGARPTEEEAAIGPFRQACQDLAREAGLTDREAQLLVLFAHGRNIDFICNELYISKNTAKTHSRNIYRKLDVHSQQELINAVERKIDSIRTDEMLDPAIE